MGSTIDDEGHSHLPYSIAASARASSRLELAAGCDLLAERRKDFTDQGWGVGVHEVTIVEHQPWMDPPANSYQVISSHREQITKLPVGATVLASTPHCPVAMFRCGSLVGIQGHPEFPKDYAAALLESRVSIIPPDVYSAAASSFGSQPDVELLSRWIVAYMTSPASTN